MRYKSFYNKTFLISELSEKEDTNMTMWKTTYENDYTEIDELVR